MQDSDPKRFYVYLHTFSDGSIYVGKGSWSRAYHFGDQRRGVLWLRTKEKYGKPKVSFLAKGMTEELAYFVEEEAISKYKMIGAKLRNLCSGGIGGAAGLTGKLSPNYGKKMSTAFVERLRLMMAGEGNPRYGAKLTEETKRRISEARTGTTVYEFSHKRGEVFSGTRYDFQLKYGFSIKQLFCKNPRPIWRGWRVSPSQSYQN